GSQGASGRGYEAGPGAARRAERHPRVTATQGLYRNAGSLLVSRVVMAALGWAGSLLIVRDLSTEDFGRFPFVFSVLGMLSIVTDMGTGRVAVAGFLADPERSGAFAGSYVVLRSLMGVAGYLAALVFVIAGGYEPQIVRATAVAGLVVVFATPSSAYSLAFQAHL